MRRPAERAAMAEPLHIGIDARELAGTPTGVGRYLAGVLQEWSRQRLPQRLTFFLHRDPPAWLRTISFNSEVVIHPAETAGTWWEQRHLPALAARSGVDVLLSPAYSAPLSVKCPSVVIIHDVSYCARPEEFHWREGLRRRLLTTLSARRAAAVVTVSDFSADEICKHLAIPRAAIVLAPQGAPDWRGGTAGPAREPIVLSVGTLFQRRHTPELLEAMALVRTRVPGARLVLIGANRTYPQIDPLALAHGLGLDDAFTWKSYVSDTELDDLYGSARVFAFLSDYEGFAMTPMEAAAHGVPSVLLDTPVAREVYGDAALRVPLGVPAIADALTTLLTDADAHASAVARGRARLEAFTWTRTATVLRETLERAVADRARRR
ncbi:MAG TPA: glycosyltransferase family 1 protein [Vicinamibacterales bacterium]|nr:glycosyltransferase family 1 protein [Vicinamibacterales bacterium]